MTDYLTKAKIINEYVKETSDIEAFNEFHEYNDVGIPLCYALEQGYIEKLTLHGQDIIDDTWAMLCDWQGNLDTLGEYKTLNDLIPQFGEALSSDVTNRAFVPTSTTADDDDEDDEYSGVIFYTS
jgi:hypothetical protein